MIFLAALRKFFGGGGSLEPLSRAELHALADEDLMDRYAQGDAAAFEPLLTRHERGILNFIFRRCGSRDRAEELTQETFLRVVRTAKRYERTAKFTTWLYTIARNLCIDESRKAKKRRTESLNATIGSDGDDSRTYQDRVIDTRAKSGTEEIARSQFMERLEAGLRELPEEQRDVFVLRHFEGLKFREIAERFDVSENTIKSRMRYALQVLQGHVAEFDGYSFDTSERGLMSDAEAKERV